MRTVGKWAVLRTDLLTLSTYATLSLIEGGADPLPAGLQKWQYLGPRGLPVDAPAEKGRVAQWP